MANPPWHAEEKKYRCIDLFFSRSMLPGCLSSSNVHLSFMVGTPPGQGMAVMFVVGDAGKDK